MAIVGQFTWLFDEVTETDLHARQSCEHFFFSTHTYSDNIIQFNAGHFRKGIPFNHFYYAVVFVNEENTNVSPLWQWAWLKCLEMIKSIWDREKCYFIPHSNHFENMMLPLILELFHEIIWRQRQFLMILSASLFDCIFVDHLSFDWNRVYINNWLHQHKFVRKTQTQPIVSGQKRNCGKLSKCEFVFQSNFRLCQI